LKITDDPRLAIKNDVIITFNEKRQRNTKILRFYKHKMSILHKLTLLFLLAMSTLNEGSAFVHPLLPTQQYVTKITEVATVLQMGWLDNLFNSKTVSC